MKKKKSNAPKKRKEANVSDPIEKAKFEVMQALKAATIKTVVVGGVQVKCVTVRGFSRMAGVETTTIRKYEQRKILPLPNLRYPTNRKLPGSTGDRLYTIDTAKVVAFIMRLTFSQGRAIPQESLTEINKAFKEEREKLLSYAKAKNNNDTPAEQ